MDNPLTFTNIFAALRQQFSSQLRSIEWKGGRTLGDCLPLPDISGCANIRELAFLSSSQLIPFLWGFGASLQILILSSGVQGNLI